MDSHSTGIRSSSSTGCCLVIQNGIEQGREITLDKTRQVIGRDKVCSICLADIEVSRKHAEVELGNTGYTITDLNSSNGLFVDERRVNRHALVHGNILRLGQTLLKFVAKSEENSSPSVDKNNTGASNRKVNLRPGSSADKIVSSLDAKSIIPDFRENREIKIDNLSREQSNFQIVSKLLDSTNGITDVDELLQKILDCILFVTQADRGCVVFLGENSNEIIESASKSQNGANPDENFLISQNILNVVRQKQEGVLTNDAKTDFDSEEESSISVGKIREAICVPLITKNQMLGFIYVDTTYKGNMEQSSVRTLFNENHLRIAMVVAHYAALTISNSRYQVALIQSERMATIGKVTATLAHHVKNILHGINGGAFLIEDGIKKDAMEKVDDGWQIVDKYQRLINRLILNMLSVSKEAEPRLEPGNVNDVVNDVIELIQRHAAEQGVQLSWEPNKEIPTAKIDRGELGHALLNIVVNAIDACRKCDLPRVDIRTVHDKANSLVRIVVVDNGPGVPTDRSRKIFELFDTDKGSRGTGLGLPVSLQILKAHGGDIELFSNPGSGSQFDLILPVEETRENDTIHGL